MTSHQLFWLNSRPFILHGSVGKGGYGEVFKAEMMLPPGMQVGRNAETGAFILNEDGRVCVTEKDLRAAEPEDQEPSDPMGGVRRTNVGAPTTEVSAEVAKALELSEVTPDSMDFCSLEEAGKDHVDAKEETDGKL